MPLPDDVREFVPGPARIERDETTQYWIREGRVIYLGDPGYPVRGADASTFRFYLGAFGKDQNACYCCHSKLTGGNSSTFRALNYAYATDGQYVWTLGGKLKDVDAESFVVCDDGVYHLGEGLRAPHGFGKDRQRVFYYDFDGKPNWVRKASPASFLSLNDGYFGKDSDFVFCGAATLPKATVAEWQKIGKFYSKDNSRVYFLNRQIRDADIDTFEVIPATRDWIHLARDKDHFYENDFTITEADFREQLEKYGSD